ncbi:MAG: hypothetical protein LBM18_05170 [Oscillospiraceae bacterium]|jgi:uncharacterized FAD-dependent dehydrogenase|nr:hypothetical protein [Oscillospiraceae bacterium]
MLKVRDMELPPGSSDNDIRQKCAKILGVSPETLRDFALSRLSIDARKKSAVRLVVSATVTLPNEAEALARCDKKSVSSFVPLTYTFPQVRRKSALRPVVVGLGPAGLFAALELSRAGVPPIVLERGEPIEKRTQHVADFWREGSLEPNSNVQFGEGGAGAFSDGKLTTGISDPRAAHVLETFAQFGAPRDILWSAKPHIGTDYLRRVVTNMRRELLSLGCDLRFGHKLTGLKIKNSALYAIEVVSGGGAYELPCDALVLAPGHSARDTFELLCGVGVPIQPKPFSLGVRIEHSQAAISRSQYGDFAEKLPPADYKLSCRLPDGRGVYSFCVCPGGVVVAAASEEGGLVTNGMSEYARGGKNINGGLLVSVVPSDFPETDPLAGLRFQRLWETRAFTLGGGDYRAPAQTVGDFLKNRPTRQFGKIEPSYLPGVTGADLRGCLPDFVSNSLHAALPLLDARLRGFAAPDAVLTGVETRSSSPVRIPRDENFQSPALRGLYPCGEGAGFAGGIVSAAVDGIKVSEAIASDTLMPPPSLHA